MLGGVGRDRGLAVAAQVGAHDGVAVRQQRGDPMPRRVGPRMPVQEHDRRTAAAMAHPQHDLAAVDALEREALEEQCAAPYPVAAQSIRRAGTPDDVSGLAQRRSFAPKTPSGS